MVAVVRGGGLMHVKRSAKKPPLGFLAGATTGWACGGTAAAVESMQGVGSVAAAAASSNSVAAFHIRPDDPCLRNDTADRCSFDILLLVLCSSSVDEAEVAMRDLATPLLPLVLTHSSYMVLKTNRVSRHIHLISEKHLTKELRDLIMRRYDKELLGIPL
ncbi:hypothetical protein BHM03_00017420 [Ensete ventricosum]|nr:hypothetical protein BHM03_00017420 [Ensete ventricosum]